MNCTDRIDAAILTDYWLAALEGSEEEKVEEHLLSCDSCCVRLREVIALAEGVRKLAREGSLRMVVSDAFLERAAAAGMRIREYTALPGKAVQCTVTEEDDLLVGRLAANLSGAKRVDISVCDDRGPELVRLQDIPVHSGATSIAFQESITFAKAAPDNTMILRLVAFDETGDERLVGEYTFNHTRTIGKA